MSCDFMQQQTAIYPGKQHRQLQKLSDTRWACRRSAINAICCTFGAVLNTLQEVINGNDGSKAVEAKGSSHVILCLIIFDKILSCSKSLSDVLQSSHLDLAKAADLVSATIEAIEDFRSNDQWEKLFAYSQSVADHHNIYISDITHRRSRPPKRYDSDIIHETTGTRSREESTLQSYKVELYYPILDSFLSELKQRFSEKNKDIIRSLQVLLIAITFLLDIDHL